MKTRVLCAAVLLALSISAASYAQPADPTPVQASIQSRDAWRVRESLPLDIATGEAWIRPRAYQALEFSADTMRQVLAAAPLEFSGNEPIIIELPDPTGRMMRFKVWESPIMEPALAAQMAQLKTYIGQGIDDPTATLRADFTTSDAPWFGAGSFHAQVLSANGDWFIDPYTKGEFRHVVSYFRRDLRNVHAFLCGVTDERPRIDIAVPEGEGGVNPEASGTSLRTYRLANAATGEYTAFHGGTVAAGQAAIVTAINRVTGVYEREVCIRLTLVANNSSVVYTNASTDPYTNNSGSTMLGQNQTNLNSVIGSGNYDIGHVFSTGGGGIAGLGVVCTGSKAQGVTGLPSPTGDAFYIDYVAHEMGHQFGSNHSFNSTNGSCNGNRSASNAYEPGSASTIMGYAGICSPDNIQNNSDAYFLWRSYNEIRAFVTTGAGNGCGTATSTGNNFPSVSTGAAYTIPANTPFALTGSGTDPDGDTVTYCWEQANLGAALALASADNGTSPINRSYTGTTNPTRLVPPLANILAGTVPNTDKVPTVARAAYTWTLTTRDNRAAGGGVNSAQVTHVVVNTGSGFAVTSQNSATTWDAGSTQTITWNVAGTTASPINCANVKISLSTDNGATFPTVLAASTPNDGTENITVPSVSSTTARVKVEAVGNIFFDINNASITISDPNNTPPASPTNVTFSPSPACSGQNVNLSATVGPNQTVDWYINACGNTLIGSGNPLTITATTSRNYYAKARNLTSGLVSAGCANAVLTVNASPVAPTSANTSRNNFCATDTGNIILTATGGSGTTLRWTTDSCGGTTAGTGNNLSIPSPTRTTTYYARWENTCGNSSCASVTVTVQPTADFNGDGGIDFFDYLDFVAAYSAAEPAADFNEDGTIDFFDYLDFVAAFSGDC